MFEEVEQVFDHLPKYHMKILLSGFFMQNLEEKIPSNRHLGKRIYIAIVMIMVLEE